MNMSELAGMVTATVISELGEDLQYFPVIGAPTTTRAFVRRGEQLVDSMGPAVIRSGGVYLEVTASGLLVEPQLGERVIMNGRAYTVRSVWPSDTFGSSFVLDCVPESS